MLKKLHVIPEGKAELAGRWQALIMFLLMVIAMVNRASWPNTQFLDIPFALPLALVWAFWFVLVGIINLSIGFFYRRTVTR